MSTPDLTRESAPHWAAALWAAIFIGIPVMIASLSAPLLTPTPLANAPRVDDSAASRPPSPPPPVEPVRILAIAPATARTINAAIPFSTAPNPAARPFRFTGDSAAQERAVDCLAAAELYEAGDDASGQKAVAQVVLNRLRHPAFPKSICGVVFQGAERTTGCQFTFTCDGALGRTPAPAAWSRAQALARQMLAGLVDKRVGYATHYHTDWVVPYWSSSLDKISNINTHLFFRWKGWWGTPNAFHNPVSGEEPLISRLAFLSPAHRDGTMAGAPASPANPLAPDFSDLARPALTITRDRIGDRFGPGRLTALNSGGDAFAMLLDRNAPPTSFEQLARQICGGRTRCRLLGWTRATEAPNSFPIDEETLATMSYAYIRMTGDGLERSLYNCREYRDQPKDHCMRDRVPVQPSPSGSTGPATLPDRKGSETVRLKPENIPLTN